MEQGPTSSCRFFDFTLAFENIILAAVPSAALILIGLLRILYLHRRPDKVSAASDDAVGAVRSCLAILHLVFNTAVLGLAVSHGSIKYALDSDSLVPALALAFVASVRLVTFSFAGQGQYVC